MTRTCKVFAFSHYFITWPPIASDDVPYPSDVIQAIPLTSQTTHEGLPTSWPINPTTKNGLQLSGFALVHQVTALDLNTFKDPKTGLWMQRDGQLSTSDRKAIADRLALHLLGEEEPEVQEWFLDNPEDAIRAAIQHVPEEDRDDFILSLSDE